MSSDFTVLTVCTGNIHRSALASDLLATWAGWYLPRELRDRVVVGSAGIGALVGEPMGSVTRRIAASLGADDRSHRARALTDGLVDHADLVLVASRAHRDHVLARAPRAMRRTFTIREAGRIATLLPPGAPSSVTDLTSVVEQLASRRPDAAASVLEDDDVVDPHRKDVAVMDDMVREMVPALAALAIALWGMPRVEAEAYQRAVADAESLR